MFPDRETDIFTGWSGSVNLAAFFTQGVKGLAVPTPGNFQSFSQILQLGDADFEAGWYMTDEQAARIVTSFKTYEGLSQGYSFLSDIGAKPNTPYEPNGAQLGNGNNCGDFAFYALTTAGVISKQEVEDIKVDFWYPRYFYDQPLPLQGTGARVNTWLHKNPSATSIPFSATLAAGWEELLFGRTRLEFFDKDRKSTRLNSSH